MKAQFKHSNYVAMLKELAPEIKDPGHLNSAQLPHLKSTIYI